MKTNGNRLPPELQDTATEDHTPKPAVTIVAGVMVVGIGVMSMLWFVILPVIGLLYVIGYLPG